MRLETWLASEGSATYRDSTLTKDFLSRPLFRRRSFPTRPEPRRPNLLGHPRLQSPPATLSLRSVGFQDSFRKVREAFYLSLDTCSRPGGCFLPRFLHHGNAYVRSLDPTSRDSERRHPIRRPTCLSAW